MQQLSLDSTYAALKGIPVFCLNRAYIVIEHNDKVFYREQYIFNFENGYAASVIAFSDKAFSGGKDWEMLITNISDIERGNAEYIKQMLDEIEQLDSLENTETTKLE